MAFVNLTNRGTLTFRKADGTEMTLPAAARPASVVIKDYPDDNIEGVQTVRREVFGLQGLDEISDGDYAIVDDVIAEAVIASNHPSKDRILILDEALMLDSGEPGVNDIVERLVRPGTGEFDPMDDPIQGQEEAQAQAQNRAQVSPAVTQQSKPGRPAAQAGQPRSQTGGAKPAAQAGQAGQGKPAAQAGQPGGGGKPASQPGPQSGSGNKPKGAR